MRSSDEIAILYRHTGFDTHQNADARLISKFTSMNAAFVAFVAELKALNLWESTVLVQFSEFGRTLDSNTNFGAVRWLLRAIIYMFPSAWLPPRYCPILTMFFVILLSFGRITHGVSCPRLSLYLYSCFHFPWLSPTYVLLSQ